MPRSGLWPYKQLGLHSIDMMCQRTLTNKPKGISGFGKLSLDGDGLGSTEEKYLEVSVYKMCLSTWVDELQVFVGVGIFAVVDNRYTPTEVPTLRLLPIKNISCIPFLPFYKR